MIIEAMGTPLVSICVAAYEPTQFFGAQDNGFSRNRRAVFSPNVGTRLYMYGGVADAGVPPHPAGSGITGTPSRFWPFHGNQGTPENRLRDVNFNNRADFAPAAHPTFDFTRAAARWDVNRDASAFRSRLPSDLLGQINSVAMNPETGLPASGAWHQRIDMILAASNPLAKDNAMNMHQDLYRMVTLTPVEQVLWALLYCDPEIVRGENLDWYYNPAHMFAPRQRYLTVSGATYSQALRNFQNLAREMNFGDGTSMIIPTRDLVDEMLAQTHLGPDDLIGYIKMRGGAMTPETLAANAVMAGVNPEAFPVLIALAQTLTMAWEEDGHQWHAMTTASQPLSLGVIVSGPITQYIGMENGQNILGAGSPVNATISRAFRLFYNNVAGNISGHIDTSGRTTRLNDLILAVFPENYAVTRQLGWQTHAELMGFPAGTSTVSMVPWLQGTAAGGPTMVTPNADPATGAWNAEADTFLRGTANINLTIMSPAHATEIAARNNGTTSAQLISEWAAAIPGAANYVTVHGMRDGETFPNMMQTGPNAGRKFAHSAVIVGPANAAGQNIAGEGPFYRAGVWSTAVISGTTGISAGTPTSPSAPANVEVDINASARTATLRWAAPAFSGHGTVEGFEVFMYHGGVMTTFDWIPANNAAGPNTHVFENLVPGEQYHFRVRAHNNVISNIYYINRQHNGHIVSGIAGVPNEFWLDLERTRGRGAWGRPVNAERTAHANAMDLTEGTMTQADIARGVRPIRSHMAVPGRVVPPEITVALQNLIYNIAPQAFYTVRLPQNIPFEIRSPAHMTYMALPQIRYRAGGDSIPEALIEFWKERGFCITCCMPEWPPIPPDRVYWTLNFDTGAGSDIDSIQVPHGTSVHDVLPEAPVKDGYVFVGWRFLSGTLVDPNRVQNINFHNTLVAIWEAGTVTPPPVMWTITFDTGGGTYVPAVTVAAGTAFRDVVADVVTTREGYEFVAWRFATWNATVCSGNFFVGYHNTLIAVWEESTVVAPVMWTVSFNTQGGTPVAPVSVPAGTPFREAVANAVTTRAGYEFLGWRFSNWNATVCSGNFFVNYHHTLTAVWG